jgi:Fis family transcriptional regulator, factor for inversion stimulation protein
MSTIKSNVIQMTNEAGNNLSNSINGGLSGTVKESLLQFFDELDDNHPNNLYDMVLRQIELPLLEIVLERVSGNQSKAAECLGINRGTLRKKLKLYDLIK